MNKSFLKGRLTKDIELRYTQGAEPKAYTNFSIAVPRRFSKAKEVDFINCQAWGKTAEFLNKFFSKGKEVLVFGRIQVDLVDTDGEKKMFFKVVADEVDFCGSASNSEGITPINTSAEEPTEEDDDLPF